MSATAKEGERDSPRRTASSTSATVEDEADVFEITDFTTASEWERFIARLEEILHDWKLVNHEPRPPAMKNQYATGTWAEKTEEVVFADFRFNLSYLYLKTTESSTNENSHHKKEDNDEADDEHKTPTVYLDIMNFDNDFPSRAHYLCRWYGLQEFFTLIPVSEKQMVDSESRSKLLLSSASIALGNSNCGIPLFIQLQSKWRKLFIGTSLIRGGSIEFEMSHLKKIPAQFCHLAGLLDIFKSKLGCVYISMPTVSVAVRFTYQLQDWIDSAWPQMPPDFSDFCDGEVGYGEIDSLPFGACSDPISELHLSCTWPCLSEDMIVENSMYSDLDPLQAPQWSVQLQMSDDAQCLLGGFLRDFLKLCDRQESTVDVLKTFVSDTDSEKDKTATDISHALHRLTEPVASLSSIPSLGNVMSSASSRIKFKPEDAPIPNALLDKTLFFLFPDAKIPRSTTKPKISKIKQSSTTSNSSASTGSEHEGEHDETERKVHAEKMAEFSMELSKKLKSAQVDSLTYKLGLALIKVNHSFGGLLGVVHLWQEFILEMRFRWENKHLLCNLEKGAPNMGSCLLHQKLQMLNCCIECKIKRESAGYGYGPDSVNIHDQSFDSSCSGKEGRESSETASKRASMISSDDEDEFFDADDNDSSTSQDELHSPMEEASPEKEISASSDGNFQDTSTHKPIGRLVPMKNIFLLATGEQLFIPITQEPSPMTEDMLEEQAEVLAKLGTSQEGSQIRARMQSACLVSDMESFKAANPGCILEDFVRWYSPRDYVVEDDEGREIEADSERINESVSIDGKVSSTKRGHLSQRMQIPGNMWIEAWQSAKAVPARRQKRLFDDTKEAEKVLHYLASMKPAEVVLHLMPCVIHAAICKLEEEAINFSVPNHKSMIDALIARAAKITRQFPLDKNKYTDLLRMIDLSETVTARTTSLRSKFSSNHLVCPEREGKEEEIESFVTNLLTQSDVFVKGGACGPAGAIIHKMFITAQKSNNMILDDEEISDNNHTSLAVTSMTLGEDRKNRNRDSTMTLSSPSSESKQAIVSDFPTPSAREYILRAMVPRPAPYSKVLPQRMYCLLTEGENRIAGAFTSDTTFQ